MPDDRALPNHTGARLRALVLALRPSRARRLGVDVGAVDDLTEAGVRAWRVALAQLAVETAGLPELQHWVDAEVLAEQVRWKDERAWLDELQDHLDRVGRFAARQDADWARNLAAARRQVHASGAPLQATSIAQIGYLLGRCRGPSSVVHRELTALLQHAPRIEGGDWSASDGTTDAHDAALRPLFVDPS